jgi:hypothetical protein
MIGVMCHFTSKLYKAMFLIIKVNAPRWYFPQRDGIEFLFEHSLCHPRRKQPLTEVISLSLSIFIIELSSLMVTITPDPDPTAYVIERRQVIWDVGVDIGRGTRLPIMKVKVIAGEVDSVVVISRNFIPAAVQSLYLSCWGEQVVAVMEL